MSTSSVAKDAVEFTTGINGFETVILHQKPHTSVQVYLYGAHVTSWKNEREELLFVSSKAIFAPPKSILGGISVSFPLFPDKDALAAFGFARNRVWTIDSGGSSYLPNVNNEVSVDLLLSPTEKDLKIWPHRFEYRLRVAVRPGGELVLTSRIRNTNPDGKSFMFAFACPAYFSVSDINDVRVEGLETLDYLDNMKNEERCTDQGDALAFESLESEIDMTYLSTPTKIKIRDHKKRRTLVIQKDGLPDAVVWNPWDKNATNMAGFGKNEYRHMLCVGAARMENPVTLKPGEEWTVKLQLSAANLS
uniref:putative glucose-6-phosphate 1-epimerase n=1 Tax=Erigeron canadensis TaxID=72917 RepID=UPI001CB9CFCE|nr:putative glucose-6-phosphate 1-epimerase [Erigeron canadensis]